MRVGKLAKKGLIVGLVLLALACGSNGDEPLTRPHRPAGTFAVFYVSNQGDDDADGLTMNTAFQTIGRALEEMEPGDTILILPGSYNETLLLEGTGNPDATTTIRGEGGLAVLDGQRARSFSFWCEGCSNFIFENLEIRNHTDVGIGLSLSSNITLRNLIIHGNGFDPQLGWELEGYGIHAEESSQVTIESNEVYQNGPQPRAPNRLGTGINTYRLTDSVIRNNRSHDNVGGGLLVEDGVNILVEGNEVVANDLDASLDEWWDGGLWLDGGHDVRVRNNVFKDNKGPGIEISDEEHQKPFGYVLENNTSTGNYFGIYIWNFGTSDFPPEDILQISKNQIFGNSRQDLWIVPWTCPPPEPCE